MDDPTCVKRDAVLNFLYVYAGEVIREGNRPSGVPVLREVIQQAASAASVDVRVWAETAATALDGGGAQDYAFWLEHGWKGLRPL